MISDVIGARRTGFDIQAAGSGPAMEVLQGIWVSEGLSNSYLIVTHEGRVVINSGMGFEGSAHRRRFDEVSDEPIRYLMFTQGHVDHVGGADCLRDDGTDVVAQAANAACQADDARIHRFRVRRSAPFWADAIAAADAHIRSQGADAPVSAQATPTPTITFDDHLTLTCGDDRLELLSTPGGETVDSMVVWLPDRGVAFVGNLFSALVGHIPNLMTVRGDRPRDALRFVESAQRVIDLEPEVVLTGHFGAIDGRAVVRTELTRVRDAVLYVHDRTVDAMNAGADVWSTMRDLELPPALQVGEGYGKVAWDVRAIWESYGGWFHHRSTTELYGVAPGVAADDVVELAGGSAAVVARAAHHVTAGRALDAIPLIDAVLDVEPENRSAWICSRLAHQVLLDEAVSGTANFWEIGWLRQQIARAERRASRLDAAT